MVESSSILSFIDVNNPAYASGIYDYWTDLSYKAKSPVSRGIFWSLCGARKFYSYMETVKMDLLTVGLDDSSFALSYFAVSSAASTDVATALLHSLFLDFNVIDYIYENPYVNNWASKFNNHLKYVASKNNLKEQYYIDRSVRSAYEDSYSTKILYSAFSLFPYESFALCIQYLTFFVVVIFFVIPLIVSLVGFYDNENNNEKSIDQEFFASSLSVESEEEIASIEDMLLGLFMLVLVFGVFFCTNSSYMLSILPEVTFMFYVIPLFFVIIYCIPALLIYDFGIFFLSVFRGSSNSSSLAMELLYDYIALASAYLRLVVQNVRLLLMVLVYASLHEAVLTYVAYASCNPFYESFWDWTNSFWENFNKNPYFFLIKIPSNILYWIYELLHTFFVVTVQFVAFFAMVFWIYLFLYTMFFIRTQENFIANKRKKRKEIINSLKTRKNK